MREFDRISKIYTPDKKFIGFRIEKEVLPTTYLEDIMGEIEEQRKLGKTIVTSNGCFDIFHYAHLELLCEAKEQGDILVVGVNCDDYIRRKKGHEPAQFQEERVDNLKAFLFTDYAFIFEEDDFRASLERIKPNVHVIGAEYSGNCIEAEIVIKNGGRMHFVKTKSKYSSTEIYNLFGGFPF